MYTFDTQKHTHELNFLTFFSHQSTYIKSNFDPSWRSPCQVFHTALALSRV